ncbi:MAG TPA: metalloprotease [Candidatus Poseidoniales archaeon]|nr:metalloprotease [Candidatus Poseidoniales archaeon]
MARDPRAARLDDDPFAKIDDNQPVGKGTSQHIRVVIQPGQPNPFEPFLKGFFDVGGPRVVKHEGSFFHFSQRELKDLALSLVAFSLGLSFMFHGGVVRGMLGQGNALLVTIPLYFALAIVAFGPAFIIHELAHKFVARHYGCWAEFRADPAGLRTGVLIAFFIGFLFMAPGAVMVAGNVNRRQNGMISLAGPASNLCMWLLGLPVLLLIPEGGVLGIAVYYWMVANAILGAFNMLPFGPLDGRKIKEWSGPVFWVFLTIFLGLVYLTILPGGQDLLLG